MHHKGLLGWRYNSRCNYMITLVTEPRTSVFGELREWGVERTDEGRVVYEAVPHGTRHLQRNHA